MLFFSRIQYNLEFRRVRTKIVFQMSVWGEATYNLLFGNTCTELTFVTLLPSRTQQRCCTWEECGLWACIDADSVLQAFITRSDLRQIGLEWHLMWRTLHTNAQLEWEWVGGGCRGQIVTGPIFIFCPFCHFMEEEEEIQFDTMS